MRSTFSATELNQDLVRFSNLSTLNAVYHEVWKLVIIPTQIPLEAVLEREVLISGFSLDIEKHDYESKFEEVPAPFTQKEREEWLSKLKGVAVSSDAFVSHSHVIPLRND